MLARVASLRNASNNNRHFPLLLHFPGAMHSLQVLPNIMRPGAAIPARRGAQRVSWRRALHVHACYSPDNSIPRGVSSQPRKHVSTSPHAESELAQHLLAYAPLETLQLQQGVSEDVLDAMRRTLSGMLGLLPSASWTVRAMATPPPICRQTAINEYINDYVSGSLPGGPGTE